MYTLCVRKRWSCFLLSTLHMIQWFSCLDLYINLLCSRNNGTTSKHERQAGPCKDQRVIPRPGEHTHHTYTLTHTQHCNNQSSSFQRNPVHVKVTIDLDLEFCPYKPKNSLTPSLPSVKMAVFWHTTEPLAQHDYLSYRYKRSIQFGNLLFVSRMFLFGCRFATYSLQLYCFM